MRLGFLLFVVFVCAFQMSLSSESSESIVAGMFDRALKHESHEVQILQWSALVVLFPNDFSRCFSKWRKSHKDEYVSSVLQDMKEFGCKEEHLAPLSLEKGA